MPTNRLSDARVRALKPGPRPQKLFDGEGLYLHVSPTGARSWRMAVRLDGRPITLTRGLYPEVSLAEAREWRAEVRRRMRDGIDPRERTRSTTAPTLRAAAAAYWASRRDVSAGYRANAEAALERHVLPRLGDRPIDAITRAELLEVLLAVDQAGRHEYVRKVRMWCGLVWERAVELGQAPANVPATIKPEKAFTRRKVEHFAAVSLAELPALLQRLAAEPELQAVLACRLLALTWVRTQELRLMRWSEIEGDVWRVPASRMKKSGRGDHLVPLSRQAIAVLTELRGRWRGGEYVFCGDRTTARPMSDGAVLALLHRIGYRGRMTGHGWRSVGSTWANEVGGFPADVIERQLAHEPEDTVRAAYNRAEYLPQRRAMLQAWADWMDAAAG